MIKVNINSYISHIDSMYPGYDMVRMVLYLCGLPLKYITSLIMRKHYIISSKGVTYKTLDWYFSK